jgi:quercetin dioxygenase-like cupin family protein
MLFNADFTQTVCLQPQDRQWLDSPTMGVQRQLLDRVGDEVARATSIVRYAPDSHFPRHEHGGGEEIVVINGTFIDESGAWPAGSYLRSPVGSSHAPSSPNGCLLFVKLHQFQPDDDQFIRKQYVLTKPLPSPITVLHQFKNEQVCFVDLEDGETWRQHFPLGGEILVLSGQLNLGAKQLAALTWLRWPHHSPSITMTAIGQTRLFCRHSLIFR